MNFKKEFSKFTGHLVLEFAAMSEKFADALKDSAHHSGEKILEAVDEFIVPSSVLAEKLSTAVIKGEREQVLRAVEGLIPPSSKLIHKFADAVKDGANKVGDKMMTALEEAAISTPVDAKKLEEAIKGGTNYANEKMMTAVDDFVNLIKTFKASK
ncbi:hypothetical protein D7Z26_06185 [Cohnella endophytica]|uniref:Uncharacterized protein n=1 Tax=Cohnella endophytica TaxID=2419778 RepID=A0A494Y437_9BACL|nr:hypothetical protein [Cohnella endophytica]RKP56225.1 hypothetical protein D7Z26_06185 [Cohnella endophytica]